MVGALNSEPVSSTRRSLLQRLGLVLQRARPQAQVHEQADRGLHQRHGARVAGIALFLGHQRHAAAVQRQKAGGGKAGGAGPGHDHIEFAHGAKMDFGARRLQGRSCRSHFGASAVFTMLSRPEKRLMPVAELRVAVAPVEVGQAEVDVGEGHGHGDGAGIDVLRGVSIQFASSSSKRGMDARLGAGHPVFPLQALGARGGLVAIGDGGIGQALAQRLQRQHAEALHAIIAGSGWCCPRHGRDIR